MFLFFFLRTLRTRYWPIFFYPNDKIFRSMMLQTVYEDKYVCLIVLKDNTFLEINHVKDTGDVQAAS